MFVVMLCCNPAEMLRNIKYECIQHDVMYSELNKDHLEFLFDVCTGEG